MSSDGKGEAVKVAVKVRPFNKRELDMNATLIVEMVSISRITGETEN